MTIRAVASGVPSMVIYMRSYPNTRQGSSSRFCKAVYSVVFSALEVPLTTMSRPGVESALATKRQL